MNEQVKVEAWARASKPYPKGETIIVAEGNLSHTMTHAGEDIPAGSWFGLSPISGMWVLADEPRGGVA